MNIAWGRTTQLGTSTTLAQSERSIAVTTVIDMVRLRCSAHDQSAFDACDELERRVRCGYDFRSLIPAWRGRHRGRRSNLSSTTSINLRTRTPHRTKFDSSTKFYFQTKKPQGEASRPTRHANRQRRDTRRTTWMNKARHVGKRTPRSEYECKIMNWIALCHV